MLHVQKIQLGKTSIARNITPYVYFNLKLILIFNLENTKILVALGYKGTDLSTVEIINLNSTETVCEPLKNFPYANVASNGEIWFDNKPIICGGDRNDQSCWHYYNGQWIEGQPLIVGRTEFAMVKSEHGLVVSGGHSVNEEYFSNQEILTPTGWKSIASLPKALIRHCLVNLNSTHIMAIGGFDSNFIFDVNILDLNTESWTVGPSLKTARYDHSCGKILTQDGQEAIIAIGGHGGESSVEVLMPGDNQWIEGPNLPRSIWAAQLVQDVSGGVVLIGGFDGRVFLNTLYKLSSLDGSWELMIQKLKTAREEHTAFLIDDDLATCNKKKL